MRVELIDIEAQEAGQRLDRWLRRRVPYLTQGRIEKLLRKGDIRVDGRKIKSGFRLREGQQVRLPPLAPPATSAPAVKKRPRLSAEDAAFIRSLVLYRDDLVIALNKPPGLAVQGGSKQARHVDGMLDGLHFGSDERPRLVHRIDKDTSGLLLLARTLKAAAHLTAVFRSREVRKLYWAVVNGTPSPRVGTIRLALRKAGRPGAERMVWEDETAGKPHTDVQNAITDYAVLDHAGGRAAWVALRPVTGRTHQLRVHMAAIGHPIAGDGKYGSNAVGNEGEGWGGQLGGQVSRKLHLHARALEVSHPSGSGSLRLSAPSPAHIKATFDLFGWDEKLGPELLPEGWDQMP